MRDIWRGKSARAIGTVPRQALRLGNLSSYPTRAPQCRDCERSEAIHLATEGKNGLLRRGACHRARIRGTRWLLAMTGTALAATQGISYTTILSAMPRNAACFWIGLIASRSGILATAGESMIGPVMWISCEVDRLCTRAAILTVWPK